MTGNERDRRKAARHLLAKSGYRAGGHLSPKEDRASDERMDVHAIHAHERNMHPGHKLTPANKIKLADGGVAMGDSPMSRPDRPSRSKGGKKHDTTVNVILAPGQGGQGARPVPVPVPVHAPPPVAAGGPALPPGGMPPRPMPPIPPPGLAPGAAALPPGGLPMRKRGGRAPMAHLTAGASSGVGRLEHSKQAARDEAELCAGGRS